VSEERVILRAKDSNWRVCADQIDHGVLLTEQLRGDTGNQVVIPKDAMREFGEWLIKRANQAGER
jgi:hypothetical protein